VRVYFARKSIRQSKQESHTNVAFGRNAMLYVYVGRNEIVALIVGLITGFLYSLLSLPIPAPPVLGGILAIIFTFIGYLIIQKMRGQVTFGAPPATE